MAFQLMKTTYLLIVVLLSLYGCGSLKDDKEMYKGKVLSSPDNFPFMPDIPIKHLNEKDQLRYFQVIEGKWESIKSNNIWEIVCKTDDKPAFLISKDRVSTKPNDLRFDIIIFGDKKTECGIIHGNKIMIAQKEGVYITDFYTDNLKFVRLDKTHWPLHGYTQFLGKWNTVGTHISSEKAETMTPRLYFEGIGLDADQSKGEKSFGIYLGSHSEIRLKNFRWYIGAK